MFISGHGGSPHQVRSLASEAARQHAKLRTETSFDFFAVDFGEEFPGVHATTLIEEAEFVADCIGKILGLYRVYRASKLPHPDAVILLGHSMGGVVARLLMTLPRFNSTTVNTLITFASPHLSPPVTFERRAAEVYAYTNSFWRREFNLSDHVESYFFSDLPDILFPVRAAGTLQDKTLVSFIGGNRDKMVSAELADLSPIVPPTHGISVFTNNLPHVWHAADHQSIVWCQRIVRSVVLGLFAIADPSSPQKTTPFPERMDALRRVYLGIETGPVPSKAVSLSEGIISGNSPNRTQDALVLTRNMLMDDQESAIVLGYGDTEGRGRLFLCDPIFASQVRLLECPSLSATGSDSNRSGEGVECRELAVQKRLLPIFSELRSSVHELTVIEMLPATMMAMRRVLVLPSRKWIDQVILRSSIEFGMPFIASEVLDRPAATIDVSILSVLFVGADVPLVHGHPYRTRIRLPDATSSIFAFRLRLERSGCRRPVTSVDLPPEALFEPTVHQRAYHSIEEKFLTSTSSDVLLRINMVVARKLPGEDNATGIELDIWADPDCAYVAILRVDIPAVCAMIGKSLVRSFPPMVVFVVFAAIAEQRAEWKSMQEAIRGVFGQMPKRTAYIAGISFALFLLNEVGLLAFALDDATGIIEAYDILLIPFAAPLALAAVCVAQLVLDAISHGVRAVFQLTFRRPCSDRIRWLRYCNLGLAVACLYLGFMIPYQVVYLLLVVVQVMGTGFASAVQADHGPCWLYAMQNLQLLMLTLLPHTAPVLVVWIKNLLLGWPMYEDHDVMILFPVLICVFGALGRILFARVRPPMASA